MAGTSATAKPSHTAPPSASIGWTGFVFIILAVIAGIIILRLPELSGWQQGYDPTGHWWLSTLIASLPVIVLLGALAFGHVKAHYAALAGLITALLTAIFGFSMPGRMAAATTVYGLLYGLFPIGWIVLNVIFLYQLTVEAGRFEVLKHSLTGITQDRRLQLLLIAFCFGAFFEGAAGFGTPVAVTAALLIGLGFRPLAGFGPVIDCQHRSGSVRRIGYTHRRPCRCNGIHGVHSRRDGGPHSGSVRVAGSVLADLGICRLFGDDRNLARRAGGRCFLRHYRVAGFQLAWSVARRRDFRRLSP